MFSCILLAAGESSRFGSPKSLASYHGQTVIQRIQDVLLQSQVDEIVIVLGAGRDAIQPSLLNHKKVKVVYNKDYKLGQTTSFQTGLRAADDSANGVFLWPVDYPAIQAATVDCLISCMKERDVLAVIPSYQSRKGHPPLFSTALKKEFLQLNHDVGLNQVAHRHVQKVHVLEVDDEGVVQTFNTPDELKRIS